MKPVKMHEAKTNFSRIITLVEGGEEVVIKRDETPVARIVPYAVGAQGRKAGALKGKIRIAPDFDAIPDGFDDYTA
jgi:antitoxin (DNA-binding transcriptional repressor) of toxin-antitoxin stability system